MSAKQLTMFKTTVWEDNNDALTMANLEPGQITLRSKFYAIKYHWFRSHIHSKVNNITIKKISTENQQADIIMKGVVYGTFEKIQKLLCGW